MKIVAVEWMQVYQYVYQDRVNSPEYRTEETRWDLDPKILFRIITDDGVIGIGETPRGVSPDHVEEAARSLLGLDPLEMNLKALPIRARGAVVKGFEAGLFDLIGKARDMSVSQLLGGKFTSEVSASYWASRQTPEDSAKTALTAWEQGYTCLKIKDKQGDPIVERIRAMYEVAPDLAIIIDPMQRYDDLDEVIRIAKQLESYNVLCLEDPLPKDRIDWWHALKRETSIPLAMHVRSPKEALKAIQTGCVDILNCSAGIVSFVQMAEMADAAGLTCWHGSGADLGILDLSYIHACAAVPNCTVPSDILSTVLHVDHFLQEPPIRRGDKMIVPDGPGLGGELDMQAVERNLIAQGRVSQQVQSI